MNKEWKVQDEIYTMLWYYADELKERKKERHDQIININQLKRIRERYTDFGVSVSIEEEERKLKEIEEELAITKSLLRRLKKIAEMYNINY